MKYSQAIIVAAIASAAVVSAAPSINPKATTLAEGAKAPAPAVPAAEQNTTTPAATTAAPHKKHGHHKKGHRAHPKGKESKIHHRIKGSAGHVNPAAAKKTPASASASAAKPATNEPAAPAAAAVARDLFDEEDLFEREFDEELDELVARGRLSGVVNKIRKGMKGHKMDTAIGAAGIAATVGSTVGVANAQKQQRDFDEELDELVARGRLGGLVRTARTALKGHKVSGAIAAVNAGSTAASFLAPQRRDFEDLEDLEAREFEEELDELVARGRLGGLVRTARTALKGHKVSGAIAAVNAGSTAASFLAPQRRDLEDLEDLEAREFEEELDELVARGRFSGIANKLRQGMKGHKMNTAIGAASIAASVGSTVGVANAQKQQRDFEDELDELVARGRFSGLGNKIRQGMKGHKMNTAIGAASIAATVGSTVGVANQQRDFDEELNELVARGRLGGIVNRVRQGMKGHKANAAFAAINAGSTAGSFMAPQRRDLDEELDELVARGRLGGIVNKVRQGMRGHKANAAFAAINAGSTAASFMAPQQQRDLGDFDDLEMRDFDFEIDELD